MRSQCRHHNGEKDYGGSDSTHLAVTLNTLGREDEADAVYERALQAVKARMAPSLFRVESYVWDRLPDARVPY